MNITTSFGQQLEVAETPNGLLVRRRKIDRSEAWHRDGKLHRDDGPAYTRYDGYGIIAEDWYQDGEIHRDNGPATTGYHRDGSIRFVTWSRDGEYHRDNGPGYIGYYEGRVFPGNTRTFEELKRDGAVKFARWYLDGKRVERFT